MIIWVDADACPKAAKELIYRASARLQLPVRLVANRPLAAPTSPLIEAVQVKMGSDVADSYIVQHVAAGDLVVTADIPLAGLWWPGAPRPPIPEGRFTPRTRSASGWRYAT